MTINQDPIAQAIADTKTSLNKNGEAIIRITDLVTSLVEKYQVLQAAVVKHHGQKADDRCWMDDDVLYAAAGLPPVDRRVGDKCEMRKNCDRFIANRCEDGGPWKSYAALEAEIVELRSLLVEAK